MMLWHGISGQLVNLFSFLPTKKHLLQTLLGKENQLHLPSTNSSRHWCICRSPPDLPTVVKAGESVSTC
ncbi:hypothetical protein ERO13_A08G252632v2 [Gossypium hirsutum]|nr:hypothetical protein ERO13_A08G252632v2 [Gossypium hirsutum]